MNMAKQSGSADCGLYTLANLTSLLLKTDPTTVIFDKDELLSRVQKLHTCPVFCYCSLPEWSCGDTGKL